MKKYNIVEYIDMNTYSRYIHLYKTDSKLIMYIICIVIKLMGRKYKVSERGKDI